MGLFRYLRRKLSTQQLNEISEAVFSKVSKTLEVQRELKTKAEQSIAIQQQLNETGKAISSKADQALSDHEELKNKADQALKAQQQLKETAGEIASNVGHSAAVQGQLKDIAGELSSKADLAQTALQEQKKDTDLLLASQQRLDKKTDQTLFGQQQLTEAVGEISSGVVHALAAHHELKNRTDQALSGQQQLKEAINEISSKADQAAAGYKELAKKTELALQGVLQLQSDMQKVLQYADKIRRISIESSRYASEAVWGELFNQVSYGSTWLKDRRFAAGRAAVGYQYLYAVYRILNEINPKSILDLGLGQSTKLISQYAAAHPGVRHQVVEHDPEWMDFFRRNYNLPENTEMVRLDREFVPYKEAEKVRVFAGFSEAFKGQKFDFISIDAPLGMDMKQYSRIDVLGMMPDCLADSFIIIIDDADRSGETHTINEMEETLHAADIPFAAGRYSGKKDCVVICSEDLKFVCSL